MTGRLQDKVTVVTGAGNGIGRATALRFAEEGSSVIAADIQIDKADETVHMSHLVCEGAPIEQNRITNAWSLLKRVSNKDEQKSSG